MSDRGSMPLCVKRMRPNLSTKAGKHGFHVLLSEIKAIRAAITNMLLSDSTCRSGVKFSLLFIGQACPGASSLSTLYIYSKPQGKVRPVAIRMTKRGGNKPCLV